MIAYATRSIFERFAYCLYRLDFKDLHQAGGASIAISSACIGASQRAELHGTNSQSRLACDERAHPHAPHANACTPD
jgi:hypothetical protein